MIAQKYTEDGYLIVAETDECPLWEKDAIPCSFGRTCACFFCRYADFRTEEAIRRAEEMPSGEKLYSVCRHEKNKNSNGESR